MNDKQALHVVIICTLLLLFGLWLYDSFNLTRHYTQGTIISKSIVPPETTTSLLPIRSGTTTFVPTTFTSSIKYVLIVDVENKHVELPVNDAVYETSHIGELVSGYYTMGRLGNSKSITLLGVNHSNKQ